MVFSALAVLVVSLIVFSLTTSLRKISGDDTIPTDSYVDIQKDIRTNTEETAVWTELTAETNERTANTLSNLDNGSGISRRSDREIPRNPNSPDD